MEPAITLLFTASLLVNATSSFRVSGMLCPLTFSSLASHGFPFLLIIFPFSQYIGLLYTFVQFQSFKLFRIGGDNLCFSGFGGRHVPPPSPPGICTHGREAPGSSHTVLRMVGEGTAFSASDWLEGLSSDWLFDLAVKHHLTFMACCRLVCFDRLYHQQK